MAKLWFNTKIFFCKLSYLLIFNSDGVHICLQCPICKEITDIFYFGSAYSEEDLFILITNDDVINFEQKIQYIDQEHVFIFNEKCEDMLQNVPSFLSLCATFSSTNCFNYLFEYYSRNNDNDNILKQDPKGRSVAHFACFGGDLQIISKLLFLIQKPDFKDSQGLRINLFHVV